MATTILGSATIKIIPDSSGFSAALQGQLKGVGGAINNAFGSSGGGGAIKSFNQNLRSTSDQIERTSNRMIGMGAAMTYGISRPLIDVAKQSVMAAADFDLALRTIAAVSNLPVDQNLGKFTGELGKIEAASRSLGKTTKFSAIEVAKGFTDLARAGLSVEAQQGAINEVIKLATVENLQLSQASDRLINVYTGFGFSLDDIIKKIKLGNTEVGQLQMVTDVLAKVSASTTSDMTSLTDAFRYAGPVAAAAGASFAETAAALGVLDQAGFKCYDRATEVMTRNGFVPWDKVTPDMELASVNPITHALEYQFPTALIRKPYKGKMYRVKTSKVDLLVTPNHRMWVKPRRQSGDGAAGEWQVMRADQVYGKDVKYLKHVEWEGATPEGYVLEGFEQNRGNWLKSIEPKVVTPEDWAEFLGFYLSEGSCRHRSQGYAVTLTQNEGPTKERMKRVLERMGFNYCVSGQNIEVNNQQLYREVDGLGHNVLEKRIPEYLLTWDRALLSVFFEAFRGGDGDDQNNLYTSSPFLLEQLQEVVIKCGWSPRATRRFRVGDTVGEINGRAIVAKADGYKIDVNQKHIEPSVYAKNYTSKRRLAISEDDRKLDFEETWVDFDDEIFCAEVPNHLLIVRRNGHVVVSGNSTVGGTALRGVLTRLAVPTKVNQETFDKLQLSVEGAIGAMEPQDVEKFSKGLSRMGLSGKEINEALGVESVTTLEGFRSELGRVGISQQELFDEFGNMRDMGEVVGIFADRYRKGMFKVGDAMKLFGQRAGPGFLALLQNEKLLQKVTEGTMTASVGIGTAAEQANKINESASVKFQMMKNALVDLNIAIGQSGVLDFFVDLAGTVGELARNMATSNPEMFRYVFIVGALAAAMGPLSIVLGIVGKGFETFLIKPLIMLTSPLGLVIGAIAALVGFFALMVSQSELLRQTLGNLFDSISIVALPIIEEFGRILFGVVGGVVSLAGTLGDKLAPGIATVSGMLNDWVSSGGLKKFLYDMVGTVRNVVSWVYDLNKKLTDMGVFVAIGDAINRIWRDMADLIMSFKPAFDNLWDALSRVAPMIVTTFGGALRVAWEVASLFLTVIEKILDVLKPIISFLGGNMVTVLGALAAAFLLMNGRLVGTLTGFTLLGGAALTAGTKFMRFGDTVGLGVMYATEKVERGTNRIAHAVSGIGKGRVADAFINMGTNAARLGDTIGMAFGKIDRFVSNMSKHVQTALGGAQFYMTAFFSGQMASHAETLGGKIAAMVPAIIAMGMAFAAASGPMGWIMFGITALSVLLGAVFGKESMGVARAYTIDFAGSVDTLANSFQNVNGKIGKSQLLKEFTTAINGIDGQAFTAITSTLNTMGSSVNKLADAFMDGKGATDLYVDNLEKKFIDDNITGKLKNFRVEIQTMGGVTSDMSKHKIGDILTDPGEIEQLTKDFSKFGLALKVTGENGNELADNVGKGLTSLGDVRNLIGQSFNDQFGGKGIRDFASVITDARAKYEAMKPVQDAVLQEQAHIDDEAKDWYGHLNDVNSALEESKRRLRALIAPQENAATASVEFFNVIKANIDKLKLGPKGAFQLTLPDPDKAGAVEWVKANQDITNSWGDFMTVTAQSVPFGPNQQAEFQKRLNVMRESYKKYLMAPDGPFKLNEAKAQEFLDRWVAMPTPEIELKMLPMDINTPEFKARVLKLQKDLSLTDFQANIMAKVQMITGDSSDPTAESRIKNWILKGITPSMTAPEVNLIINALNNLPPDLDLASFGALIKSDKITPKDIPIYMNVYGNFSKAGLTQAQVDELLATGRVSVGNLSAWLDIKTQVDTGPLAGKLPPGFLDALAVGAGSKESYDKTIKILTDIQAKNPALLEKTIALVGAGVLPAVTLPITIDLISKGVLDVNTDPATLAAIAAWASGGHMHAGGIVGLDGVARNALTQPPTQDERATILQVGEAVLPRAVVASIGEDAIRQLINGQIPAAILNITVDFTLELIGADVVGAGLLALMDVAMAMISLLQSSFAVASIVITGYIGSIVFALQSIIPVMAGVSSAIQSGFSGPINFIENIIWPHFAKVLNGAASAFGLNAVVPVFHEGGIVGEGGSQRKLSGGMSNDEMMALLQKGEGVMSQEMMASMTAGQMAEFRRGNPRWFAVGGPYESGQGRVNAHPDAHYGTFDLEAMKAAYEATVQPLVGIMQSQYANNVVAQIGAAALDKILGGAYDWTNGANDAATTQQVASIGLPPGFDLKGALPAGFNLGNWRSFLGANKAPGDWPLIAKYLDAAAIPYLINSTFRPDGTSYHASGRAVDFGSPGDANYDSPGLLRINNALAPLLGVLSELIYAGPGGITDKAYDSATMAEHHNHVHAALARGGIIQSAMYALLGEAGPEVLLPLNDPSRALDIALASNLIPILRDAAAARTPSYGPAPLGNVQNGRSAQGFDGGFLGGGPGNSYTIHGIDLEHVKTEIKNRDAAVMRVRR